MTTWNEILADEMQKDYYQELQAFVQKRRAEVRVFPEEKNVFNALELTPFESVKVVILGQDPFSWIWSSAWIKLFCSKRNSTSSIPKKYL